MPRDIGPQMLAQLDRQLSEGDIDDATYEARKVSVLELIRKKQAFTLTLTEKVLWGLFALVLFLLGAWLLAIIMTDGVPTILNVPLVAGLIGFGLNRFLFVLRH